MSSQEEKVKTLQRAQILSQQIRALEDRFQILQRRKEELTHALKELKKAEERGETNVYQFLGANILVKKNLGDVKSELEEELTTIESQLNLLKRQIDIGKKELEKLLKKLGYTPTGEKGVTGG